MEDTFSDRTPGLTAPPTSIASVVPDDAADLARVTRAINVATTGTVRLTTLDGSTDTLHVAAGIAFPIRAVRIWATGTEATGIKALV